jgi:hypothetical protein
LPQLVQIQYNWVHEIEIEFGEGRLGVSLREVRQLDSIPYPQFQAEVDDLPKVNGKAGPAELYNWSVKPPKRLTIGMRITFIDSTSLAGFTYKEVVDKLKRASRPVKLKFADVDQGTLEENPEARQRLEQQATAQAPKKSKYLEQKQAYTRVLVTSELHTELWTIETKKLDRQQRVLQTKWATVSSEYDALNARRVELQKDHDKLLSDKQHYGQMIKQLKAQESHEVGNPEFVKANDLAKRHAELTDDITKMGSGNKRLRKEKVTLQLTLDELENELAKLNKSGGDEDDKANDDDLFFGIDPAAPPADQLAAIRKKIRFMDDELIKEQRKAARVEKEMEQLNRHLTKLSSSSSSSSRSRNDARERDSAKAGGESSSSARDSARASDRDRGDKPSDVAGLEMRILELRKKQRAAVESISKAAKEGDKELAREGQKKRKAIKEELARAQDALQTLKAAAADGREEPSRGADRRRKESAASTAGGGHGNRHHSSAAPPPSSHAQSRPTAEAANGVHAPAAAVSTPNQKRQAQEEPKMPTLSGFLEKGPTEWSGRGLIRNMKTMRGARERWCEICADGKLRYYKRRGDDEVRGEIDLGDASFEVTCEDLQRGKEFVLCTSDQQSHFFTRSNEELQVWVRTLRAANAFLKNKDHVESIARKLDAADKKHGHGGYDDDEQFYGRATLGF